MYRTYIHTEYACIFTEHTYIRTCIQNIHIRMYVCVCPCHVHIYACVLCHCSCLLLCRGKSSTEKPPNPRPLTPSAAQVSDIPTLNNARPLTPEIQYKKLRRFLESFDKKSHVPGTSPAALFRLDDSKPYSCYAITSTHCMYVHVFNLIYVHIRTYVLHVQMLSQSLGSMYVRSVSLDFIFVNNLYLLTFSMQILSLSKGEFLLCENKNVNGHPAVNAQNMCTSHENQHP